MYAFDFVRPKTLAEAAKALSRDEAQSLGRGQTLIPALKQRLAAPSVLVGLARPFGRCRGHRGAIIMII